MADDGHDECQVSLVFSQPGPQLHSIPLESRPLICLLPAVSSIQHLVLGPCRQLDDNGLKALVQTLPNLQSLCLNGCPDLRDVTPLSQLSQLTSLTVKVSWLLPALPSKYQGS